MSRGRVTEFACCSFDPDPGDLRGGAGAMDMTPMGGYPGAGMGGYGPMGPPGAGPGMAVAGHAPPPGYGHGGGHGGYAYGPGPVYGPYGPSYPYQHHQQLVHRPNVHADPAHPGERAPSKCGMFWRYVWKLSSCLCSHVTLVSLVIAYCLLGAMTFEILEKDHELQVKKNITYRRSNVTQWLWTMTSNTPVLYQDNWTMSAIERLKVFEKELLWHIRSQGWDGIEDEGQLQWTFPGALFYSIIVITTIGECEQGMGI
ncbi:TWiK family of potassium channels protein 7, partial [Frankliniella fusca]